MALTWMKWQIFLAGARCVLITPLTLHPNFFTGLRHLQLGRSGPADPALFFCSLVHFHKHSISRFSALGWRGRPCNMFLQLQGALKAWLAFILAAVHILTSQWELKTSLFSQWWHHMPQNELMNRHEVKQTRPAIPWSSSRLNVYVQFFYKSRVSKFFFFFSLHNLLLKTKVMVLALLHTYLIIQTSFPANNRSSFPAGNLVANKELRHLIPKSIRLPASSFKIKRKL